MQVNSSNGVSPTGGAGGASTPTLPVDTSIPPGTMSDPAAVALLATIGMSDGQLGAAKNKVIEAEAKRGHEIERARKAILAARAAEKDSGFWGKIASVAKTVGIVAGIAGSVCAIGVTGGSSLVLTAAIVGATLSAGSVTMRAMDVDVNYQVAGLKLTLSDTLALTGAACSIGAGFASGAAAAGWVAKAGHYGGIGCRGVEAGARGTQAVATEREGHYAGEALDSQADHEAHRLAAAQQGRNSEAAIDLMRTAAETKQRAMRAVAGILEEREAAMQAVVGRRA